MSAPPRASVVMCARNEEARVSEAIASVLAQTLPDFELIVIDDASTDRTIERIRSFTDPRIRLIENKEQLGIPRSRNLGTSVARAPVIVVADSDDLCAPNRLEEQLRFLDTHPQVGAVGSFAEVVDEDGRRLGIMESPLNDSAIKSAMKTRSALIHVTLAVRKASLLEAGGYRDKFIAGSDYDMLARLSEKTTMATIPALLYRYRLTPNSISTRYRKMQRRCIEAIKRFSTERAATGRDGYDSFPFDDLASLTDGQSPRSSRARYHLHAAKLAGTSGIMALARSHFFRTLLTDPTLAEAWLLLVIACAGRGAYQAVQRRWGTSRIGN